jgi:hypothetical protein
MKELVFFLEEESAKEFLKGILPRFLPSDVSPIYVTFEGKNDLQKNLERKLRAWIKPALGFVVLQDKDHNDCIDLKAKLQELCQKSGKSNTLVRIACHHLESWYIGNLTTVLPLYNINNPLKYQSKRKYRNPDALSYACEELKKLTHNQYQKINGSRRIGAAFPIDHNTNRSHSYRVFIEGIHKVISVTAPK